MKRKIGSYLFVNGQKVSCTIKGIFIEDAVISMKVGSYRCWICHNISSLSGSNADNMFGYKYSWSFIDEIPQEDGVHNLIPIGFETKSFSFSDKMHKFFQLIEKEELKMLFTFKMKGVFEDFTNLSESQTIGFVTLTAEVKPGHGKKKVDIKISRLIRQATNYIYQIDENNVYNDTFKLSDQDIEKIYNKYVSFQNCEKSEVEFLSGEELLEGYRRDNYIVGSKDTVLHKSCMVDRLDFLDMYTKNPNQVKIALLKFDGKIAARCLVWKDISGKEYYDRIYYQFDWLENLLGDKLKNFRIYVY